MKRRAARARAARSASASGEPRPAKRAQARTPASAAKHAIATGTVALRANFFVRPQTPHPDSLLADRLMRTRIISDNSGQTEFSELVSL